MANTSSNSGIPQENARNVDEYKAARTEEIRSRAFAVYEARGRDDGHELDDWLLAERQILRHSS